MGEKSINSNAIDRIKLPYEVRKFDATVVICIR